VLEGPAAPNGDGSDTPGALQGARAPRSVRPLASTGGGYFELFVAKHEGAVAGALYRFRLDDDAKLYPDPASRFQPEGPHGPSQLVDPRRYTWKDASFRGISARGQVLYELHIGTFTREGTYRAAMRELPRLAALGVTVLEVMPVADFPGRFGWGYDGVNLFAPTRLYGEPDDFRAFVDEAHRLGLGVILDVVYNHLGPDGNYLPCFSDSYFSTRHKNEWGEPMNFDGADAGPVREFFVTNAAYWIDEFHLDGLRLDATQSMFDASERHIVADVVEAVRRAANGKATYVVAENEPQAIALVRDPKDSGMGVDALWNDDFHHTARVALTGHDEAYYRDYRGTAQELVSAVKWGFLYQGQHYAWQKKRRGTPSLGTPLHRFVAYLQNHDQVANALAGARLHAMASPGAIRALTALMLLAPSTPLLFMGQEYGATTPFLYFADQPAPLAKLVREGRRDFLAQFPSIAAAEREQPLDDPGALETFEKCRLDADERTRNHDIERLHADLLRIRREDATIADEDGTRLFGAALSPDLLALRYRRGGDADRLLVVNLGRDRSLASVAEPLLSPAEGFGGDGPAWELVLSTESVVYGGAGAAPVEDEAGHFHFAGRSAALLRPATGTRTSR
jgi:maltooligosyltrehalose trehalohydrolase